MDALAPVHVATIVSTRGNRGEVAAVCPSGRPERLQAIRQVKLGRKGEAPGGEPHELSGNWVHKGRWILHFQGFETISRAESLVGREVYLDECDLPMLPEGHVYTYRLVGARVQDPQGRLLGYVQDTETGRPTIICWLSGWMVTRSWCP